MKRNVKRFLLAIFVFVFIFFFAVLITLYLQKESRPVIFCGGLDDSIRPRNYCLMNPFRDKQPEIMAEEVLQELKNGNYQVITPYLSDLNEDRKNHFLENEKKFQIKNWRIGNRENTKENVSIMFWVSRQNYFNEVSNFDYIEEVHFYFVREGNAWKLKDFSAIY